MEDLSTPHDRPGAGSARSPATAGSAPGSVSAAEAGGQATAGHPPAAEPARTGSAGQPFGAALEPVLLQVCGGRLSKVTWFRTTWQRSGALTGYADWRCEDGRIEPAVVKLPVPPRELQWLLRLQGHSGLTPRVHAYAEVLGGYDMAWVVMERVEHGPMGPLWQGKEFDLLIEAAGRFYAAAAEVPVTESPPAGDWRHVHELARQSLADHDLAHEQRWKNALKKCHRKLPEWLAVWDSRPRDQWCHGDLHLGNALSRRAAPEGPAVLIDFAEVRPGCWVEDGVYFEHLFWSRRQRLEGRKLCSLLAHARKTHGLHVEADWPRLASVRRALVAMSTPAMLDLDGQRQHVQAALEVLEKEVGI